MTLIYVRNKYLSCAVKVEYDRNKPNKRHKPDKRWWGGYRKCLRGADTVGAFLQYLQASECDGGRLWSSCKRLCCDLFHSWCCWDLALLFFSDQCFSLLAFLHHTVSPPLFKPMGFQLFLFFFFFFLIALVLTHIKITLARLKLQFNTASYQPSVKIWLVWERKKNILMFSCMLI